MSVIENLMAQRQRKIDIGKNKPMDTRVTIVLDRPIELKCPRCNQIHDMKSLSSTQEKIGNLFSDLSFNKLTRFGNATCVECGFMMAITLELMATAAPPEKLKLVQEGAQDG